MPLPTNRTVANTPADHIADTNAVHAAINKRGQNTVDCPQITADQNDYNPTGLADADVLRLTSDALRSITGIVAPTVNAHGRKLTLINANTAFDIRLPQSNSSAAANRFDTPSTYELGDSTVSWMTLRPGDIVDLIYDATSSRWKIMNPKSFSDNLKLSRLDWDILDDAQTGTKDPWEPGAGAGGGEMWQRYAFVLWNGASDLTINSIDFSLGNTGWSFVLFNRSATKNIVVKHQGGVGGYGILLPGSRDLVLTPKTGVFLFWEANNARWMAIASSTISALAGPVALTGDIASTVTGAQNDFAPTGLESASVIEWAGASAATITGLTGGYDGRIIVLRNKNTGAGASLTLKNQDAGSSGANRFFTPNGVDYVLAPVESVVLQYSSLTAWTLLAPQKGGGPDIQVFSADGTWTKPAGKTLTTVIAIGGGGGGGGGESNQGTGANRGGGAGGSGGSVVRAVIPTSALSATEAVVRGAGGAGGAAVTNAAGTVGSNGTASTFGSTKVVAKGGPGAGASSGGNGGSPGNLGEGPDGSTYSADKGGPGGVGGSAGTPSVGPTIPGMYGTVGTTDIAYTGAGGGGGGGSSGSVGAAAGTCYDLAGGAANGGNGTPHVGHGPGSGGGGGNPAGTKTGGVGGAYGGGGGGGAATGVGVISGAGGAGANGIVVVISE